MLMEVHVAVVLISDGWSYSSRDKDQLLKDYYLEVDVPE